MTLANKVFCHSTCRKLTDFLDPAPTAYGHNLFVVFSKTFQITKTFHVAMLQHYMGCWDSSALQVSPQVF